MRINAKRIIECGLLCLLMAAAGFLGASYYYQKTPGAADAVSYSITQEERYGAEQFRTERQQLRSMQKAQINEIIYNSLSDQETVSMAQKQLLDLLEREEMENKLEGMLEMRGFSDVIISIHRDGASVLVGAEAITKQESGIILDLVCRETGFLGSNIKIIPIN